MARTLADAVNKSQLDSVSANVGALTTDDVAEASNLYYTTARFDTAFAGKSTDDLAEGANLYFTDERVDDRVSALVQDTSSVSWSYDDSANTLEATVSLSSLTTDDIAEGANLYYTDTRADARITAQKGVANGLATLDGAGLIPSSQLPSFVDDVEEYADFASLPATGETGKLYITLDDNRQYRWSGSVYVQITSGAVDSVNSQTGVVVLTTTDIAEGTNLYYTEGRVSANADVVANTAKVSADGSIDTHSDVDVTTVAPSPGDALVWDGSSWAPAVIPGYTSGDFDTDFAAKTTDDLAQGTTNRYYSSALFDSDFAGKTTSNLAEGANLYFTDARARTAAVINNTSGNETDQAASVAAMKTYVTNVAPIFEEEIFVLTAQNITDGYVDLQQEAITKSEKLWVQGGNMRVRGDDFTVSVPSAVSRVTFAGSLASTLVAGNKIVVSYAYYA
jgi:predicted RecA/RadA family phage recombinase